MQVQKHELPLHIATGSNWKVIDYYDELDAISEHRPSVSPSVMMESMLDCDQALSDELPGLIPVVDNVVPPICALLHFPNSAIGKR